MLTRTFGAVLTPASRTERPGLRAELGRYFALRRQRMHLGQLDAHLLNDIGLSADQALHEAQRKPWDVPTTWRR